MAILYLGIASGIAMEVHFCMGKKVGVEFFGSSDDHCSKCGMKEKKGGCCKDEHRLYKLKDDHKIADNDFHWPSGEPAINNGFAHYDEQVLFDYFNIDLQNYSPPDYGGQPAVYILNGVFRV